MTKRTDGSPGGITTQKERDLGRVYAPVACNTTAIH